MDVADGDGVIDGWLAGAERSFPACRTGLLAVTGAANDFIFGMLLLDLSG